MFGISNIKFETMPYVIHYAYMLFIPGLLVVTLLSSCINKSRGTAENIKHEITVTSPLRDTVDSNFNDFIEKFSTDSAFQLSRTRFPLKIKWYDQENDRDSLIYKDRTDFEMMDFRKKKSDTQYDKWEQKRVVDKNRVTARIEIRGIDNGIIVDYLFDRIKGAWTFVEIDDSST